MTSLLAPLYLAALAALALPWLLHRFNDAEPERRPFPSTRFLEPTAPPVSRRRKLRYRALFALRALAVLALALLFAEPWIPRPSTLGEARALHLVAVDTSLSMRAGERFERALEGAREALAGVPAGEPVRLVAFARDVRFASAEPMTVQAATTALGRGSGGAGLFEAGFAAADYGRLMQRLDRLADESELPVRATLVTDLQRSSLPERRNALYAPRLTSLDIVDVGVGEANVALAAEATSDNGAQARVRVTLVASASGTAGDAAFEREIVVGGEGGVRARERVRLAPGARESVVFEAVTLPETPEPRFEVGFASPDALIEDDSLTVPVRLDGARRVALAALEQARVPDAARVFVTTALEADGAASVDASRLAEGQLPEDVSRLVVFAPLGGADPLPTPLRRFVARGGGALVIVADASGRATLGNQGSRSSARPNVGGRARSDGEGSGTLAQRGSGVGRVDVSHPLALGDIDWGETRFYGLGEFVPEGGDRVLVETAERRPVLIERPSEAGLLLILNERLDGGDSNLPFQPAFVALMRQVVDYFDAGRAVPESVTVGDPLALPVNVQVIDPDGRPLVALADTASAQELSLDTPGLYTVVGALGEQELTVAIDPRESDLAPLDTEERAGWLARHASESAARERQPPAPAGDARDALAEVAPEERRVERFPLWPLLLPLLAVMLLAETLYANRRLDVRRDGT